MNEYKKGTFFPKSWPFFAKSGHFFSIFRKLGETSPSFPPLVARLESEEWILLRGCKGLVHINKILYDNI